MHGTGLSLFFFSARYALMIMLMNPEVRCVFSGGVLDC